MASTTYVNVKVKKNMYMQNIISIYITTYITIHSTTHISDLLFKYKSTYRVKESLT